MPIPRPHHQPTDVPITVEKMLDRWGERDTLVILGAIQASGSPYFTVLSRGGVTVHYKLILEAEIDDPVIAEMG